VVAMPNTCSVRLDAPSRTELATVDNAAAATFVS
jgi:hypothetical protein